MSLASSLFKDSVYLSSTWCLSVHLYHFNLLQTLNLTTFFSNTLFPIGQQETGIQSVKLVSDSQRGFCTVVLKNEKSCFMAFQSNEQRLQCRNIAGLLYDDETMSSLGAILNESSLFTYDSKYLLDSYLFAPKHDPAFSPAFAIPDNPDDPLLNEASKLCTGGGSKFCRYDTLVARSLSVGNATRVSFNSHATIAEDLSAGSIMILREHCVENCHCTLPL